MSQFESTVLRNHTGCWEQNETRELWCAFKIVFENVYKSAAVHISKVHSNISAPESNSRPGRDAIVDGTRQWGPSRSWGKLNL
jgi:hypothetical protein